MIFGEARCIALVAATLAAFFLGPTRLRHAVLIASGMIFYWWYAPAAIPLIAGLVLLTHWISGRLGIALNVLILAGAMGYFKWQGGVGALPGMLTAEQVAWHWTFPLGLSFLAFELIHFSVERWRGKIRGATLQSLAAFAWFFPCRIAGPIKRYPAFEASVRAARWSGDGVYRGLARIVWGFLKKVVIADVLVLVVPELDYAASPWQAWKAVLAYTWYLYIDFSAYSDIAIGLSWLFGLEVPENFRSPYFSRNIQDFWKRWHMSLSSWLLDYVYFPLARRLALAPVRFSPRAAAVIGYLVTFAVCGLWHGPALNFLLWGLYHGLLMAGYALVRASGWRPLRMAVPEGFGTVAASVTTFLLVALGWVLFAMSVPAALRVYGRLLGAGR